HDRGRCSHSCIRSFFKSPHRLEAENLFLRHQLSIALPRAPPLPSTVRLWVYPPHLQENLFALVVPRRVLRQRVDADRSGCQVATPWLIAAERSVRCQSGTAVSGGARTANLSSVFPLSVNGITRWIAQDRVSICGLESSRMTLKGELRCTCKSAIPQC